MSRILLDTSAYSAMIRGNKDVLDNVQTAESVAINPIILGELLAGFAYGSQERQNTSILDKFLSSPRCSILPIVKDSAIRYTSIYSSLRKAGTPIPTNDLWIASTAMEHGLTVVTLDKHFLRIPQILCRLCTQ